MNRDEDKAKMEKYANPGRQADEALPGQAIDQSEPPVEDIHRLVHQLQERQIELEAQNKRLRHAHDQLETRILGQAVELSAANKSLQKEIAARKRAEEALNQKRTRLEPEHKRLRTILDILPLGLLVVDATGEIRVENPMIEEIWGAETLSDHEPHEYKGWWASTGRRVMPEEWPLRRALTKGEVSINEEINIETFDGRRKTILSSAAPFKDEKDMIAGAVALNMDISGRKRTEAAEKLPKETLVKRHDDLEHWVEEGPTELAKANEQLQREIAERKQAVEALAQEHNLLRTLVDNLPDFIFVKDTESRFVINNLAHVRVLGAATQAEVLGKTDFDIFPQELAAQYYADEQAVIQTGQPLVDREEPYIDPAGNLRWLSTTKVALQDSQGQIVGLVGISRDITEYKRADELLRQAHDESEMRVLERTAELVRANETLQAEIIERKQAEQALRESEARFAGILDIAKEAIISVDESQQIIVFNKGAEEILGYSANEAIGQPLDILIPERFRGIHHYHLAQFSDSPLDARSTAERLEIVGRKKHGQEFPAEASISRLQLGSQSIYTAVLRDITKRKQAEAAEKLHKEALRESEQRYKQLLGSVTDYIYTVQIENGRVVRTSHSPNCVAVTGYTSQEYEADPNLWYQMIYEENRPAVMEQAGRLLAGEAMPPLEHRIVHKDGSVRWVRNTPVLRKDERGNITSYDGLIADITERKQAEEALRKSESKYRLLLEQASDAIIITNEDGDLLEVNSKASEMLGYTHEELLRLNARHLIDEDDRTTNPFGFDELLTGETLLIERRLHCKDGTLLTIETSAKRLDDGRLQAIIRDITARKRAEAERERLFEEVKAGRERLQALSHRLVEVQEAERRHIARELHDEIGQLLTGLKLTLEMSARLPVEAIEANLDEAQALVNELIAQVRELSLELRPAMLDDLGLVPTLLWHFERYTAQTQIQVNFKHTGLNGRFASEVETTAYRIVQEALTNVARYSRASDVTVRLWIDQDTLNVQIEDRGVGFDPEAKQSGRASSGISGMHERAALLGGQLMIESTPQTGTRLTARLPLVTPVEVVNENQEGGT